MRFPRIRLLLGLACVLVATLRAESWQQPSGNYVTLRACHLIESGANDGDSFMVKAGDKSFLFRLYSVDTIETTMNYPQRVAEQAQHFGITAEQAVKIGLEAEKFTQRLLAQPFTVQTCWQDAKGASRVQRFYAVITLSDGRDLAEQLAAAGLARVYGWTPTTPGFSLAKLKALETQAKTRKLGAYGSGKAPSITNTVPPSAAARLASSVFASPTPGAAAVEASKVDINSAAEAALIEVPGIGPYYAKQIIAGRPYAKVEDIGRIRGIGAKTLAKLVPFLTVGAK